MSGLPAFGPFRFLRRIAAPLFVVLLLAASVGFGAPAQAGVATPALAAASSAPSVQAEPVRWVCGTFRCVWRPNYPAYWYVPPYARGWGPPVRPACYWRRSWGGWVHVCP